LITVHFFVFYIVGSFWAAKVLIILIKNAFIPAFFLFLYFSLCASGEKLYFCPQISVLSLKPMMV
jgi:hypothetical protein